MSEHLKHRMKQQGWSPHEIKRLSHHLKRIERKKSVPSRLAESLLFWIVLFFAILTSLSLSFFLFFLHILFSPFIIIFIAASLGILFGMLFEATIRHIDWIEAKHHFVGGIVILLVVSLNILIFSHPAISGIILFGMVQFPAGGNILVGGAYLLGFSIPFIFHKLTTKQFY